MNQTKKCLRCGQQTDGSAKFCPRCGSTEFTQPAPEEADAVNQGNYPYQPGTDPQNDNAGHAAAGNPGVQPPNGYTQPQSPVGYVQPPYGYAVQGQIPYSAAPNTMMQTPGMKWFKFLIYFALFFGAVLNIGLGMLFIQGEIYSTQSNGQITAEMIYTIYPRVRTADILYGIYAFAAAVLGIYTRFQLAKFKSRGPMCLYICYGAAAAVSLIYNIALCSLTGVNTFSGSVIVSTAGSVVLIVLNIVYFNKRKAMFVN